MKTRRTRKILETIKKKIEGQNEGKGEFIDKERLDELREELEDWLASKNLSVLEVLVLLQYTKDFTDTRRILDLMEKK